MISFQIAVYILLIHWVADFVLQTDKQAKGKSKNWSDLLSHTLTYSLVWLSTITFCWDDGDMGAHYFIKSITFTAITFICHTITDYYTSRLNAKLWAKGDSHNFFISVGFDQVLHYIQLFGTYLLLR